MSVGTIGGVQGATAQKPAGSTASAPAPASAPVKPLPVWFFGFEAVFAAAYDLIKAYPQALWLLGLLAVVNIALTLTVLRTRVRLARRLWRGKGTRKVAIGLAALRIGSHFALLAVGTDIGTTAGHIAFAVAMGALTVALLWFTQHTALRALATRNA